MFKAEAGVMHFEDGGETASQGLYMVTRCFKETKRRKILSSGLPKGTSPAKPGFEPSEIDF